VALIAQLGEHCIGIQEVVGSNHVQSLNFFKVFVSVMLRLHPHLISLFIRLLSTDGHIFLNFSQADQIGIEVKLKYQNNSSKL